MSGTSPDDAKAELDGDPEVIVCQGPPVCELCGDEVEQAQRKGCIWCKRIIVHEDGTKTVIEPGRA